jgi:tRNA (mo5U34)-methyltransferase
MHAKIPSQQSGCHMASAREVTGATRQMLIQQIEDLGPWFHNYELASGVWTNPAGRYPGIDYPLQRWRLIEPLLPEVKGKSCLDVGCSSGFFSLKLKELGAAHVLGIDFEQQPKAIDQAKFAARTLGLEVEFRVMSAYDLAGINKTFDVVLFMGVFYHLRHPLVALEAVRAVCGGTMIFQTITTKHQGNISELLPAVKEDLTLHSAIMNEDRFPALRFIEGRLAGDTTCWFVPNVQAARAILRSCNFRLDEMTFTNEQDVIIRCSAV